MQNKKLNFLLRKYIFLFDFGLKFPWNKNKVNAYPNLDSLFFSCNYIFSQDYEFTFHNSVFFRPQKKKR